MKKFLKLFIAIGVLFTLIFNSMGVVQADDSDPVDDETKNPVVFFLAGLTGLETQTILDLQETGYGLGQIAKAYHFIDLNSEGELENVLSDAKVIGWGNLYKSLGYQPSEIKGLGWLFKHNDNSDKPSPPDHANNDKDNEKIKDTSPPDHANNDKIKDEKDKDKDK